MTVTEIREFIRDHKIKIVDKNTSFLMKMIAWFLSFTRINKRFLKSYWTTIGRTIYVPYRVNIDNMSDFFIEVHQESFEHEFVHVGQWEKWNVLYAFSYLFLPIPFGMAWFRWYWERVAYLTNLKNGASVDWVVAALSKYGWPWPRKWMRSWFAKKGWK